jgi:iron complex outermembrane recepter protein
MSIDRRNTLSLRLTVGAALALASSAAFAEQTDTTGVQTLEEVVVTGSQVRLPSIYAGGQVARGGRAGILGNVDSMDTPFSSTNYTADLIANQQAISVADVLLNDPVVRVARGFGNFQELYIIRGFPAYSDDMTYNGIYGILPREFVASEFLERVELLRGASAFLNGAAPGGSNLGGTVNLVPKRAPDSPLSRVTAGWEDSSVFYGGLDFGRRFGDNNATGVRANLAIRDGTTSVDDQKRDLRVASLGLDHRGDQLRLSADLGYQDQRIDAPRPSVTPFGGIPSPPKATINFGQPWTYTEEKQTFGVVRAEYDFQRSLSGWAAFGARDGKEYNVLANPTAAADGSTTSYRFDNVRKDSVYSGEVGLRFDVATGPVKHRLIASASTFSINSKNAYGFSNFFAGFAGSLYQPMPVAPPDATWFTGGSLSNPLKTFTTDTHSWALADSMTMADGKVILTVGARDQTLKGETFDYNSGASTSKYDKSKVTPVGGIVWRPMNSLSVYANYIEGLVAGDVPSMVVGGLPVVNGGVAQDPYQAKQFETGIKYDFGGFGLTADVFEIKRAFGIYEPYTDPSTQTSELIYRADGEQRNRGAELSVYGQAAEHVRLLGGLTFLDATYTRTQDATLQGKDAVGSPRTQGNFNVEWDIPGLEALTLDARVIYTASQWADGANTLEVASWTRFDVGARFLSQIGAAKIVYRARIDNVADKASWVSVGGYPGANYLVLGEPRTFSLSASVDF